MRCADCKAWLLRSDNPNFGLCRMHAPRPTIAVLEEDIEYQLIWPSTGKDDVCQEFLSH